MHRNGVNLSRMIGLAAVAAVLVLATGARTVLAQDNIYALSYYSNAHTTGAPDATLRFVNDGNLSDHSPDGDLCASTYVFDNNEELIECCSCYITPNGLLTLSVNRNLTSNTLTGKTPTRGVIKVISSARIVAPEGCDATTVSLNIGIRGWLTHIQKNSASSFSTTEEELTDSTLSGCPATANRPNVPSSCEVIDLAEDCKVLIELGSGHGTCDCTDAGR